MPHATMQDPPIPLETRPDSLMPQSLLALPSLKQYMVHRLVDEGISITTMEAALSHYDGHYQTMANVCAGASEGTITFMADKLFWRSHCMLHIVPFYFQQFSDWNVGPHEQFPRYDCYLTPRDREVIHEAYRKIPVEKMNAMNEQMYRAQQQRCLELYVQEAQAWSRSIEGKIAQMVQECEKS